MNLNPASEWQSAFSPTGVHNASPVSLATLSPLRTDHISPSRAARIPGRVAMSRQHAYATNLKEKVSHNPCLFLTEKLHLHSPLLLPVQEDQGTFRLGDIAYFNSDGEYTRVRNIWTGEVLISSFLFSLILQNLEVNATVTGTDVPLRKVTYGGNFVPRPLESPANG